MFQQKLNKKTHLIKYFNIIIKDSFASSTEPWKKPWLVGLYKGFYYPIIYRDCFINHEIRIPKKTNQDFMESSKVFFFVAQLQSQDVSPATFQAPTYAVMALASVRCGALEPSWINAMPQQGSMLTRVSLRKMHHFLLGGLYIRAPPRAKIVRHSNDPPKKWVVSDMFMFFVWVNVGSLSLFGVILKLRSRSSCSDPEFRKWWILEPGKLGFPIWWESKGLHAQPKYSIYQGSCGFVEDWTTKWDRCSNSETTKMAKKSARNRLPILDVGNIDGN